MSGQTEKYETPRAFGWRRSVCGIAFLVATLPSLLAGQQPSDIQNLITSSHLEGMLWPNFSDYRASLQKFYESAGYAPAWVQGQKLVPQVASMIEVFKAAGKKGLNPEDYDSSRWEERIRALQSSASGPAVARFDVALTVCTMRYVSDVHIGRINPQNLDFDFDVSNKKLNLPDFVRERLVNGSDLRSELVAI